MQKAVAREWECIDLDFRRLPGTNEADIAVRHICLDFEATIGRYNHEQGFCWRDPAPPTV